MHIPDGYLSPSTCGTLGAAMVPFWVVAGRRVRSVITSRYVPYVALGASFSFIVMMFNIPVPDGTTAHGVAGTLTAILLGPWAAVIAVSAALFIQALFFGDGGVLAIGVNCFNMAVVLPFVGYGVYRALSRKMTLTNPRRAIAAGFGAYVGLNASAMCAAVEFGLQPDLFKAADGTPLYAPFHLSQTLPAMALAHLTVAGLAEFALTFGVIAYLQRANVPVLRINHPKVQLDGEMPARRPLGWRWVVLGLGLLVVLTPLGLLAPGGAFGEGRPQDLDLGRYNLQAVPAGLARWSSFWDHAVLGGYGFGGGEHSDIAYVASALVGVGAISLLVFLTFVIVRFIARLRADRSARGVVVIAGIDSPTQERTSLTPAWLLQGEVGLCPCGCIGRRNKTNFIDKTITGASNVIRHSLFTDDIAARPGLLQRIDPRAKAVTMFAFVVAVAFLRNIPVLLAAYAVAVLISAASRIPVLYFIKRVWLFVPLFTGIVVVPAMFNFITPGHIVVPMGHWFGHRVGLTSQGLRTAGLVISRVVASISFVVLLTLTTPWMRLLAALRAMFVPRMFILVLGMAYRYVFHLLGSVTDMYEARKARAANVDRSVTSGRAFVAGAAGALFGKAHAMSEEVHQAMVARGYSGQPRTLTLRRINAMDVVWVLACTLAIVMLLGLDRAVGG